MKGNGRKASIMDKANCLIKTKTLYIKVDGIRVIFTDRENQLIKTQVILTKVDGINLTIKAMGHIMINSDLNMKEYGKIASIMEKVS